MQMRQVGRGRLQCSGWMALRHWSCRGKISPFIAQISQSVAEGMKRGAYILAEAKGDLQAILLATGSEVSVALAAQDILPT